MRKASKYPCRDSGIKEYELIYADKEREEDILADTMSVPLREVKTFRNGDNISDWTNMLIFGDNLHVLKTLLQMKQAGKLKNADGTLGVRLVYIDPPFSTQREFRNRQGQRAYSDKLTGARFLEFLRKRLVFLRELLSDDGSIYVHLDWHVGHYVRVIMDEIFGYKNFRNEIVWHYGLGGSSARNWPLKHDNIFLYCKTNDWIYNPIMVPATSLKMRGELKKMDNVWDIPSINNMALERIAGYPTQKPEALLERIIRASSNPGDLVLDCFAGSGTTLAVAEKLGRRWIGVDWGELAIYTIQKRLLNIAESKDLEDPQKKKKYGKPCKPFTLYSAENKCSGR